MNKIRGVKLARRFKQRFLFVGRNSGFHGLNRLFNPFANLLSRIFWLVVIVASIVGVYLMMEPLVELGTEINYTPDTRYLNWTTAFPGVTVCEDFDPNQAVKKFVSLYPSLLAPLDYNYRLHVTKMLSARGKCNNNAQCAPCGTTVPCDVPWRTIIEQVRKTCGEIISECRYNGVAFPCCQHFKRVDSEHGPCFAFNSLQHREQKTMFAVNRTTGPAVLSFRLMFKGEISIHSPEELSTNNLDSKMKYELNPSIQNHVDWLFKVVEIDNDVMLQRARVHQRQCRFLHEVPNGLLHTYPVYSNGACQLATSTEETFKHCGCIHPARDLTYESFYCNYTGINCWNSYEENKLNKPQESVGDECLQSCVESELTTVHFSPKWLSEESDRPGALVNVQMVSLPTLRYQRNLRRTHLDLVVSVGGIAGLFFSASVLSFLEIFYLIFRPQKFDNVK